MKRIMDYENGGTFSYRGELAALSGFVYQNGFPANFVISGGTNATVRYEPLYDTVASVIGKYPVIILHSNSEQMERLVLDVTYAAEMEQNLWLINDTYKEFEPLYGMSASQTISTLRRLAQQLNYSVAPRFERIVRAHISILHELEIPISLSGFYYLTQFSDMGEFHRNIMELPCGELETKRIWADLAIDDDSVNSQFDLFRAVINNLAAEAERSGWNTDNAISRRNLMTALNECKTLVMSIDNNYTELLLTYFSEELRINGNREFVLILDGIEIQEGNFFEYICKPGHNCHIGMVSENIVSQLSGNEDRFLRFAETIDCFIIFKHSTGKTATILSEVIGKWDYTKEEFSQGYSRGAFKMFPRDRHSDVRYSTENRYRVMPEEIIGLQNQQAIVFDTIHDCVIYYN